MQDDTEPKPTPTPFNSIPVEITVSVGRARPSIQELLALGENAVLALDKTVDAPVDLFVGDRLIGRGQLEEAEDNSQGHLNVRITEVVQTDGAEL